MAAGISLRQIAADQRVSYEMARQWALVEGWLIVRPAKRSLGIPALYHYGAVQAFLEERDTAKAAA